LDSLHFYLKKDDMYVTDELIPNSSLIKKVYTDSKVGQLRRHFFLDWSYNLLDTYNIDGYVGFKECFID